MSARSKFRIELERRPDRNLVAGEPVIAKRRDWKESTNGRRYRDYGVFFPAAPMRTAAEIFGLGEEAAGDAGEEVEDDADIPF